MRLEQIAVFECPGEESAGLAWDGSHLWLTDSGHERIFKIDPQTGDVVGSHEFTSPPAGLTFDGEFLWQVDYEDKVLCKIDKDSGQVLYRLSVADAVADPSGLGWDGFFFWIGDYGNGRIVKVDPKKGSGMGEVKACRNVCGVESDGEAIWYANPDRREIVRVRPGTGRVLLRQRVEGNPNSGLTHDGKHVWHAEYTQKTELKVRKLAIIP